jgi:putative NADH-flavin reductase
MIGSRILRELVNRGHQVTAVVRNPSRITEPKVAVLQGDILDENSVTATARGSDAAISAYGPGPASPETLVKATTTVTSGLRQAGVRRLLVVGGAGSLEAAPGLRLVDTPNFPAAWRALALAHADALEQLRTSDLDWTSVSPAALVQPGERTGTFRLGKDALLTNSQGESRISAEDFAAALVDELEKPRHIRQRFTVAY